MMEHLIGVYCTAAAKVLNMLGTDKGDCVETAVIEGFAADEILKAAEENSAEALFIAVKQKGFVERALLGTTAERVIREAHIPVLSIPSA